jgi:alpha-D-ribose 1-methylphosphonate 5-triphosphate synthase subunit PhnH
MEHASYAGGFSYPPHNAATAFRAIMQAMARPGTIHDICGALPPAPLSVAAGTVLMTLCDPETPVHLAGDLDTPELRDWITFHTGAPLVAAEEAVFVVTKWGQVDLATLALGTPEYPDRSATVIVELPRLEQRGAVLRGPGIKGTAALNLPDLNAFQRNAAMFPLGLDFMFTSGGQIAALPRTTKVA